MKRWLIFTAGVLFIIYGCIVMLFSDTLWANRMGAIFSGIGTFLAFAQLFFPLPLDFSRSRSARKSPFLLPPYFQQENISPKRKLIIPDSYIFRQKRQQRAKRAKIAKFILALFPPISLFLVFVWLLIIIGFDLRSPSLGLHTPSYDNCTILTKNIVKRDNVYRIEFTVHTNNQSTIYKAVVEKAFDTAQTAKIHSNHFLINKAYPCFPNRVAAEPYSPPFSKDYEYEYFVLE